MNGTCCLHGIIDENNISSNLTTPIQYLGLLWIKDVVQGDG